MKKNVRTAKFEVKQMDNARGTFQGYASVFGNRDNGGDVVQKGAFARSINAKGGVFPILFSHAYRDVPIGKAVVKEDDHGLFVDGSLFINDIKVGDGIIRAIEKAKDVYYGMVEKILNGMSFMYDVIKSEDGKMEGEYTRFLKELKLYEVSIVNFGMNELAGVITVKGDMDDNEELISRLVALEKFKEEITSKDLLSFPGKYDEFKSKVEKELEALQLKSKELTDICTSLGGEPAEAAKAVQQLIENIESDLKSAKR